MSMTLDYALTAAASLVLWGAGGLLVSRYLIPRRDRR